MTYLLDTNTCIQYLRGKNPEVLRRISAHPAANISACSIVVAELEYGATRSANPVRELAKVASFLSAYRSFAYDDAAASLYVRYRVALEARGLMIGHFDLMIAAVALVNGLTLVTHNTGEFSRVLGLTLEDWEVP